MSKSVLAGTALSEKRDKTTGERGCRTSERQAEKERKGRSTSCFALAQRTRKKKRKNKELVKERKKERRGER